jgi:hypothetical protein
MDEMTFYQVSTFSLLRDRQGPAAPLGEEGDSTSMCSLRKKLK